MKHICKRVKRAAAVIAILAMCLTAGGCGEEKTDVQIDPTDFMTQMLQQVKFDCDLYQVKPESVGNFFTLEEGTSALVFMGSGAYADHAGVFTSEDEAGAEKTLEMVQSYVEDLKQSFEDYMPEEAAKIDGAVVEQRGRYVVLCITSDDSAKSFIDTYFEDAASGGSTGSTEENSGTDASADPPAAENGDGTESDVEETSYPVIEKEGNVEKFGYVIEVGDTAYELYSYNEEAAEKYTAAVNQAAASLQGKTKVYDILIPLSSGITLPDRLYGEIPSSSQKKALQNIASKLNEDVNVVNPYDSLMKHRDEYIYFRTDHHWTADGAYYAYEEFCRTAGIVPIPREKHESVDFDGFLGSFYKDTKESKAMKKNPDSIRAYYPVSSGTSLTYTTTEGKTNDWDVIYDVSDYGASMKYSTFIAGDNPYTVIENDSLQDGSSCIVVKESFGNALVPFLADHYQTIYVIDYRYWNGNLTKLAEEKNADDLIFMNNLSMIRSDYLVGKLSSVV